MPERLQLDKSTIPAQILYAAATCGALLAFLKYRPFDDNLRWYFLGVWFATFLLLASTSRRSVAYIKPVRRIVEVVEVALILFAILIILNGALDYGPPAQADTQVLEKSVVHGPKRGTTYYLVVSPSWRVGQDREKIPVSVRDYGKVETGDQVHVVVHSGAFSLPWGRAEVSNR